MKKFLIKVNGNDYEVEVEEVMQDGTIAQTFSAPVVSAPAAAPVQVAAPAPAPAAKPAAAPAPKPAAAAPAGSLNITAPMPGTILKIEVNPGQGVKKGQVLLILEAMKMENEIVAPRDAVVASINVSKGASVNAGDLMVSLA